MLPFPCGRRPQLLLLGYCWLWAQSCLSLRVLSGQKICYGDSTHPCYKIAYFQDLSRRLGFQEARLACEIDGGVLLSLESETEQKLIENMLQNLTKSGLGISDGDFWIGLWRSGEGQTTSSACPDLYKWTDGSNSLFRNWYTDEPSCGSEACVVMYHQPTANPGLGGPYLYQWNDDRCNMKHNFICKYGPDDILEKELGDRADPDYEAQPTVPAGKPHDSSKPEDHFPVVVTETGLIPNLIYVVIPTIPLLLLILVAFGTCCFQMLHKSKGRTKTSPDQSTLWISKNARKDSSMEV
ncbi:chondrolectin isoform X1 [Podarcis raffonei]|uniref:Chondrolectin n=2 Tax=Podarcis TaxID=42163 RepID=A0A670HXU6_PODMU|nr:chondrolectin isoform X1 [Podarcis muralis]XP_053242487.1 chondrolectin isoform X1 [Podarcis raffonei]CAI5772707.1 C-type lectin domain-containing protein [Podarcis lilfordi]